MRRAGRALDSANLLYRAYGAVAAAVAGDGRDLDGRYAASPLKPWFDQLKSRNGLCCSSADGYVVADADWEAKNGHYRVRVPKSPDSKIMVWVDVPANSVITEPNKAGRTMVWPVYFEDGTDDEDYLYIFIRCFMPGSMT